MPDRRRLVRSPLALIVVTMLLACAAGQRGHAAAPAVQLIRTPDHGVQPQAAVGADGVVHLIYYKGDPKAGDVYYVRSADQGRSFSKPIRVNSLPGSAVAMGTMRGAHLALGRGGRVHVAWMGSQKTVPESKRKEHGQSPMLYTRHTADGKRFEPQRNVMTRTYGLDGGGSLAADDAGNVYVAWHGAKVGQAMREEKRAVWVTRSKDDGKTFSPETRANAEPTGACGCCGMRAFADADGRVVVLFRTAKQFVNRDMYVLVSTDHGVSFNGRVMDRWLVGQCPASTAAIASGGDRALLAWETQKRVHGALLDPASLKTSATLETPAGGANQKHPVIVANRAGHVLMAWTVGTGWNKAGSLAWQLFDRQGRAVDATAGQRDGVPKWSLLTAFARSDGGFVIVY